MKLEPRPAVHMEKQLRWACKLGGVESLKISKGRSNSVSQVDGVSDMAPSCGFCWLRASAHLDAGVLSFSPYAIGAFQATTPVLQAWRE